MERPLYRTAQSERTSSGIRKWATCRSAGRHSAASEPVATACSLWLHLATAEYLFMQPELSNLSGHRGFFF